MESAHSPSLVSWQLFSGMVCHEAYKQTVNFYRPVWNSNHFKNHTMSVSIARLISKLQASMAFNLISNPDKLTCSACMHMHSGHCQTYRLLIQRIVCAYFSLHERLLMQRVGISFWAISHTLIYQHSLWLTSSLVSRRDWAWRAPESDSERGSSLGYHLPLNSMHIHVLMNSIRNHYIYSTLLSVFNSACFLGLQLAATKPLYCSQLE